MRTSTLKPYLAIILTLAWSIACVQAQFSFTHIGTGATGSLTANPEPGSFTLIGGGDDIWDASDNFDFGHYPQSGDFDLRVRVESLEFTATWTKAGLMARESMSPDSRMAFNRVTPSPPGANDSRFSYRTGLPNVGGVNGGAHEDGTGSPQYPNAWLRLVRAGNVFNAYASTDGLNWRLQGSQDTTTWQGGAIAAELQVGLGVSRHSGADTLATCEFRDFGDAPTVIAAISTQPADQTVEENFSATLRFSAPGGFDIYDIQWRRDGADIPGATAPTYNTGPLSLADSGHIYSVAIRHKSNGSTATSGDATVTVVADTTAPAVVSATATPGISSGFNLRFSEPINEEDAENLANYAMAGATISGAVLQADNQTVRISTSPLNTSGCKEITVSNIRDRAATPNSVAPTTLTVLYADGVLRYDEYRGIGGGNVSDLTGNAKFPNSPDLTRYVTIAENPNGGAGQGDNYGGRLAGYLTAPVTGDYRFYIAADDGAALYLSTDENPANKVLIATEPVWNGFRNYTTADRRAGCGGVGGSEACENVSALVPLVCGNRYYIEGLWKEGGGGDHMSIAWQPPGAGVPTQGIPGAYLSPLGAGPIVLAANLPADTSLSANQPLVLSINITGGTPTYYIQWYKDGSPIPGATGTSISFANAQISDSGTYHATVENGYGITTSRSAVVEVTVDTVAPSLVSASAVIGGGGTQLDVVFSEPVNEADAENIANYSVSGVTVSAADLLADGKTARLTTSDLYGPGCKILTVNNIKDRAIPPNELTSAMVGVVTAKGNIRYEQYNGIGGVAVSALTGHDKFKNATPDLVVLEPELEGPNGRNGGDNFNDYGARLIGYVHPPVSGDYRFYIAADDHALLYVSTDESPANKVLVAREPNWANFREYTGWANGQGGRPCCSPVGVPDTACLNVSGLINLEAGCKYFIEFIYKEGGGGDYGSVAWQLPGAPVPANGSLPIQGAFLSPYEPAPSEPVEDTAPPQIDLVAGSTTLQHVSVHFNEPVTAATAGDPFAYTITSENAVLAPVSINISADAKMALLILGESLALNTLYTVTVNGIEDLAGNVMDVGTGTFHSAVEGCGGLSFEAFNGPGGYGGTHLCGMLQDPSYPNNPWHRRTINIFDTVVGLGTDNFRDNYGGVVKGLFVPPYSGDWVFYLTSDDAGQLFFNPNGPDPAGAISVAWQYFCCNALGDEAISSSDLTLNLIGGRPYYIEGRYKEAGGGDNIRVAARIRGSTEPLQPISARDLGQYAEPGHSGGFDLTQSPTDQTVLENRVASFSATAVSELNLPVCYQWFRDGSPIDGATGPTYSLQATLADNGAVFTVRASIIGAVIDSAAATLTVNVDTAGPRVVSASGTDTLRNVIVRFDELVGDGAADPFSYGIPGLDVSEAVLLRDGMSVKLTTTPQVEGTVYTLTVNGVYDVAATPNVITTDNTANFTAYVLSCGFLYFAAFDTADVPGNMVSILTADPDFPDYPRDRAYITSFNSRAAYPDDSHEQYGGRIHGVFIPPVSGNWIFYLRSDDASELWLNPSGNDPGGKVKIAEELGCCRQFADIPSAPQALLANTPYYIEGLYKEGGGGDYIQVAAKLESDTTPPNSLRPIGGTSLGIYADPTGASITIVQQPVAEQTVCLNPRLPVQPQATFSVSVDATPAGNPVSIQWQRWNGDRWVDVGATGPAYSFTPSLGDSGARIRAAVYTLGAAVNSSESVLTVQQMNTEPSFSLGSSHPSDEDAPAQSAAGFASDISPHSIPRVAVEFATAFDSAAGLQLHGVAAVRNGRLELTTPAPSLNGAAGIAAPVQTYESLELSWKSYIGDGGGGGADGYSVNIGDNIAGDPSPTGPAEEGHPNATLNVTVDTFNNAELRNPDEGIQIEWRGAEIAFQFIPKNDAGDGNYLRKSTFVDAKLTVDAAGLATFIYDGNTISGQIPDYAGVRASRVVFWARTGGASDNQWIDDLNIKAFPFDSSSVESGQQVAFDVSNDNPALFSMQPAISPDGTLTYAAAPNACGSAIVTVVAMDDGGTDCNGRDTSDPKTFTIDIACVNDCPEATPQSIAASAGVPITINLTGTDVDGDSLTASVASSPQHGTLNVVGGALQYTANVGYEGPDSFTFTVSDGLCTSAPATVSITVTANTPPTCVANVSPADCGITLPNSGKIFTISVDGTAVCLALDGSGSSDADGDSLTTTWVIDETNTVSGAVATACLEPGCHRIVMIVTDGRGGECRQEVEVCVITASEAVEQLIDLVESTPVERKNKRPLIVSLKAAKAAFDRDGIGVGGQMLQVFRLKVGAQISGQNPAEAAMFDQAAADILKAVECVVNLPPKNENGGGRP